MTIKTNHDFIDSLTDAQIGFLAKCDFSEFHQKLAEQIFPRCCLLHFAAKMDGVMRYRENEVKAELARLEKIDRETG